MKKQFAHRFVTHAVKAALLSSIITVTPQVFAEDKDDAVEKKSTKIEHIEVTSRRRTESLNKIPVSVVSFNMDEMEKSGIKNINDLASNAVGFSMEKTFGRQADIPVIRGVSWIPGFGSQKASYFIDGIYYAGSIQSLPMDLIERVEIIKGPQSALFGRRTFSGAINLITRRPNDVMSGYVNGTIGQNGNQQFGAGGSLQVNDELAIRASISTESYDGDWTNERVDGPNIGGESSDSIMIGAYYTPSDKTEISINYVNNKFDDEHQVFIFQGADENNCYLDTRAYFCGEANLDNPIAIGGILDNDEYGLRGTREHLSFKVEHIFDAGTLTWMSGSNTYDAETGIDQTYAGLDQAFSFGYFYGGPYLEDASSWHSFDEAKSDEYSHEIRFASSAFDEKLLWSLGAYLWHSENDPDDPDAFVSTEENSALMGMVSYQFTDQFSLSAELRNSTDKITTEAYDNLIQDPTYANTSNEFSSTTTRVIAEYNLDKDTMMYATRSEGNSPGGFNADSTLPTNLIIVEEEEMVMLEAGVKTTILDDSLYLSAAIYNMDWDKQQLTDSYLSEEGAPPASYTSNAGKTEVNGLEVQGKYIITPDMSLDFGFSQTDATFVELFDGNHCRIISGLSTAECNQPSNLTTHGDLKGNTPPQVPKNEVSLGLNYSTALTSDFDIFTRLDVNYDSTRYAHVHNLIETGARTLVNLNVGVENEDWRVTAWVKNLTDDDTPTYVFRYVDVQSFAYGSRAFPIAPSRGREMGITFSYMFEGI
ncbi:TonB-dependent receptor [Psychrosphaera sp. F3M07]|uniref:TonB-dependent receptor n=1 Tax=Psychrosphaera sp. F3M07 TaxID=2841560 RepID=UPI001C083C5E|nr:TonB-dependent receptor [Psychrosphaera sp. F3M07]MBU2919600.1 TonB-dependent receptor [Psychrosphaera sp. F3M07]